MIPGMLESLLALLVVLISLAVASLGGWPVSALVLRWSRSPRRARPEPATRELPVLEVPEREWKTPELLRGGLWIGLLERLAVTATVLAGHPELIAIVVALKGLGRYPELRAHAGASERFLVGTFASMLWAVGVGAVGVAALHALG